MPRPGFDNEQQVLEYMRKVAIGTSGFSTLLGLEPVRCWDGTAEIEMEVKPEMTQHHGFAHGDDQGAFVPLGTLTNPTRIGCAPACRRWTTTKEASLDA